VKPLDLWSPPEGAGEPVGCLATTFTFDEDFFSRDCISRFLGLTASYGEGDRASDLSLMIEEEERLAEAPVVVLVDHSHTPEPRNLRWDLLHVRVPGGLLHAKTAVLIWERALRLIIGSANLTPAGYRRQVEMVTGFEITPNSADVPRPVAEALLNEMRLIGAEVPPQVGGARDRALAILDIARERVDASTHLPDSLRGITMAVAPVRPGHTALDPVHTVWRGPSPRYARVMSPFWDSEPGEADANGVAAVAAALSNRRRGSRASTLDLLVTVEVTEGGRIVRAPLSILDSAPSHVDAATLKFAPDEEGRRLHAKWLQYENDSWIAVMFGSSNITAKGLGLDPSSHRELNLWIGVPSDSPVGKRLRSMVADDGDIGLVDAFEPDVDEDDVDARPLPAGFVAAVLHGAPPAAELHLYLDSAHLPATWSIRLPDNSDGPLVSSATFGARTTQSIEVETITLADVLTAPTILEVAWDDPSGAHQTSWAVNVEDPSQLPPPAELRELTVDALLTVLASTRPMRAALEAAIRAQMHGPGMTDDTAPVDPLKKHVLTTALLPRVRRHSAALWGIQSRLERPVSSIEAVNWRLAGTMGPTYLVDRIMEEAATSSDWLPGEAQFLLAELALTVRRATWDFRAPVTAADIERAVNDCVRSIATRVALLSGTDAIPQLRDYIDVAIHEATQ
jgi:hypothetical protein